MIPFPSNVVDVTLTPEERLVFDAMKKKAGYQSDARFWRHMLYDTARSLGIKVPPKTKRKKT